MAVVVRNVLDANEEPKVFSSYKKCAEYMGVHEQTVTRFCRTGKSYVCGNRLLRMEYVR